MPLNPFVGRPSAASRARLLTTSAVGALVLSASIGSGAAAAATPLIAGAGLLPGEQAPYTSPVALPGTIEAENYDQGGEGVAYHDFDAKNINALARTSEGVDVVAATDGADPYAVGHIRATEWLEYTVDVATAGDYDIGIRFASAVPGGRAHVEVGGVDVTGPIQLTTTDGYQNWSTNWARKIPLSAGAGQVVRLVFDTTFSANNGEVGNVASIRVRPASTYVDPWPSSWTPAAAASTPRIESGYQALFGKVYAFGGFTDRAYRVTRSYAAYDVASNTWTTLGTLPARLAETHLGITNDGRYIYLAGGFSGDLQAGVSPSQTVANAVFRYDPLTDIWTQIGKLPQPRGAGALVYCLGKLHYFGGNPADRVTDLGTHWVLDLARKTWSIAAPMPDPKDHFTGIAYGTKIYAIGGEHGHDVLFDTQTDVHAYDVITNTWTQKASLPSVRSHTEGGAFISNGRIVLASGQVRSQKSTAEATVYDPSANEWSRLPVDLPAKVQGGFVQRVGPKIVVGFGGEFTNSATTNVWTGQLP